MKGAAACLICCLVAFPAFAAPSLVGIWFGQGQPYDKRSMYIDRFFANGKYRSEFRDCQKDKAEDSHEDGTWLEDLGTGALNGQGSDGLFCLEQIAIPELLGLVPGNRATFPEIRIGAEWRSS